MLELTNSVISIDQNKFKNFESYSVTKTGATTNYGSVNSDLSLTVNSLHRLIVSRQDLRPISVLIKLHSLTRVTNAIDITSIDNVTNDLRFNVSYHFQSTTTNTRYILTTRTSESMPVLSLQSLYPAFN
jgi:NADH:ubiquinone oxidoreductase subunit C